MDASLVVANHEPDLVCKLAAMLALPPPSVPRAGGAGGGHGVRALEADRPLFFFFTGAAGASAPHTTGARGSQPPPPPRGTFAVSRLPPSGTPVAWVCLFVCLRGEPCSPPLTCVGALPSGTARRLPARVANCVT